MCMIATGSTSATVRMEVHALIDESLPSYYERFFRKVIPIIARMDFERGDKLIVQKENFPVLSKFKQMRVLPEEDLMKKADRVTKSKEKMGLPGDESSRSPHQPRLPGLQDKTGRFRFPSSPQTGRPRQPFRPRPAQPAPVLTTEESAQVALDEGRLKEAARLLQSAFDNAPDNRARSKYMGMLGSVHYSENDLEKARESWERAAALDPTNLEVRNILNFLENPPIGEDK